MAKERLEPEVIQVLDHIEAGEDFLLSGGAGSGKTYSLVQVIKSVLKRNPLHHVACMTYTNAAVKEIEHRVNHENLSVSTIHDFLWDNIKFFQRDLKYCLIQLINDENSTISVPEGEVDASYFDNLEDGIQYKEWTRIKEGIISHDEVLELANQMFKTSKVLCDILKDRFQYFFIDEYQDTHPDVVDIFLCHIKKSSRLGVAGFFGDAMQAIYEDGIGNLDKYKNQQPPLVQEVKKEQNRRNPKVVIDLANRLRTDGITQRPSDDDHAPNMKDGKLIDGEITFLYSDKSIEEVKNSSHFANWNFNNSKETKELNLTHNLIAPKAGYLNLMEIYDRDPIIRMKNDMVQRIKSNNIEIQEDQTFDQIASLIPLPNRQGVSRRDVILGDKITAELYSQLKDRLFSEVRKIYIDRNGLIDDKKSDNEEESKKGSKRDNLIKHLFKIQTLIHLYREKQFNEFIRRTEIQILKPQDKIALKQIIEKIDGMSDSTIEDVIEIAHANGICRKDDKLETFIQQNEYLYNRVKKVRFYEFQKLFYFLEGFTPFSTQHKIKGAEFDDVLVILDNGGWNSRYNFQNLFLGTGSTNVLNNSQKIFYVCCTRAKRNLAVYFQSPNLSVVNKAKEWFGDENVHEV